MTRIITDLTNHPTVSVALVAILLIPSGLGAMPIQTQVPNRIHEDLMTILDGNGDGALDPFEALDRLLQIESQTGGRITRQSLKTMLKDMEAGQRAEVEDFLDHMDHNGDGKVTIDEVDVEMRGLVQMFDKNQDGTIDVGEALNAEASLADDMLLSTREIEEEVTQVFAELDANKDNVLVKNEFDDGISWQQIRDADMDGNQKVSREEFKTFLAADNTKAKFDVDGYVARMSGVINSETPTTVLQLIFQHPRVRTIVMHNVPGSIDDEANLRAARYIRKFGFTTVIEANGSVASGGTDFFLAGVNRIVEKGAKLGIHSWGGPGFQGRDVPRDDSQHQLYLRFYQEMDIPSDFYWRTLEAAPANDIH